MNTLRSWGNSFVLIVFSLQELFASKGSQRRLLITAIIRQVYFTGVKGLLPVLVVGFSVGVVVSFVINSVAGGPLQLLVGQIQAGVIVFLLAKLIGPLLIMLVVLARSGAAMCIELGYMKVEHELEALTSMGISPTQYVVAPRIVAMVLAFTVLLVLGIAAGVLGSLAITLFYGTEGFQAVLLDYFDSFFRFLHLRDLLIIALYSLGFGILIPGIACYHGLTVKHSISELPSLVTQSVANAMILCILYYSYVTVIIIIIKGVDYWLGFPLPF